MARCHTEHRGGRSEDRGYVCTDPCILTVNPRTRLEKKISKSDCTAITLSKAPPQATLLCTERMASTCRYLTKFICTGCRPTARDLEDHHWNSKELCEDKLRHLIPGRSITPPHRTRNCGHGIARAILHVQKGRFAARGAPQARTASHTALRKKNWHIKDLHCIY